MPSSLHKIKCQGIQFTQVFFPSVLINDNVFASLSYAHTFHCSHFVSAKADDLINAMFMRVVADVLGIKLTSVDLEHVSTVIKADIVQYKDTPTELKKSTNKRTRSTFCTLQ